MIEPTANMSRNAVLETEGLYVRTKKTSKVLIDNVNLTLQGFVALMGPSGSGKSTLLKSMSRRLGDGAGVGLGIKGKVLVNGNEPTRTEMTKLAKVVPQFDRLLPDLTVRELLRYQARMCMSASSTEQNREEEIERIVETLMLKKCVDTRCNRLSGGEQRRVSVSLELLSRPQIMFLDEPTSGLDSSNARTVISALRKFVDSGDGCTVICSIHQPSALISDMFDDIVVLHLGSIVYQGTRRNLPIFLEAAALPSPPLTDPLEVLLDACQGSQDLDEDANELAVKVDIEAPASSEPQLEVVIENRLADSYQEWRRTRQLKAPCHNDYSRPQHVDSPSGWLLFQVLCARNFRSAFRNIGLIRSKVVAYLIVAVILGTAFLLIEPSQENAFLFNSVLFMAVTQNTFTTAISAISEMSAERAIFAREYANGLYGVRSWWAARCFASLTFQVLFAIMFSIILYFLTGMHIGATVGNFFIFLAGVLALVVVSSTIGLVLAVSLSKAENALLFVAPLMLIPLVFSGFILPPNNIPVYYIWIYEISYVRYAYSILVMNLYGSGFYFLDCVPENGDLCQFGPGVVPGQAVLDSYGDQASLSIGDCFAVLCAIWVFLIIIGGIGLKRTSRKHAC